MSDENNAAMAAGDYPGYPTPWMYDDPGRDVGPKCRDLWKPVIAAVQGMACGGAFYMLGEVEFVIAADDAVFFDPHVTYGMTAAFEPIQMLSKMPFQEIMRLSLLGAHERMSAERAREIGLVTEVVPRAELRERAAWAARVIADSPALVIQGDHARPLDGPRGARARRPSASPTSSPASAPTRPRSRPGRNGSPRASARSGGCGEERRRGVQCQRAARDGARARPRGSTVATSPSSDRWVDVDAGEVREPGVVVVEGDRITAVEPGQAARRRRRRSTSATSRSCPGSWTWRSTWSWAGRAEGNPRSDVQDDPAFRTLRATLNCRTTLLAGFTTVRNLGLFVKTGGYLLDVALARAVDLGWIDGPRIVPAGHAITPTGGHLDPTMFQRLAPDIMPLTVEEGIANGVPEVRKAVRYQIKYGARLIKISASGGVMSHSGLAGAQQYSDEEIAAIVDEAHRAGHQGRRARARRRRHPGLHPRRRRLHRARLARQRRDDPAHGRARHVPRADELPVRGPRRVACAPELQAKAAEVFPKARAMLGKAIAAGVKIACGTDAPAIPHGDNAKELWAMVDRGMSPMQALQAATVMSAELIDVDDRGRLAPGLLADIIAVPGDPSADITTTQDVRFVMKGGRVYKRI